MPNDEHADTPKVWCVVMDDGDYHCEGDHTVAICTSRDRAEEILVQALAEKLTTWPGRARNRWSNGEIIECALDVYPADDA